MREIHTVTKVTRKGIVYVDGVENVGFTQEGEEVEPGAFRFKFAIHPLTVEEPKKRKGRR